jgi:hypothetical protein
MSRTRELYRVEHLPVFQNRVFESAQQARDCVRGDVVLVQDVLTGLVFNRAFDPGLVQYDAGYQNEQACSAVFREHLDQVGGIVLRHFRGRPLIEVGCGKGYFLNRLSGLGFDITGMDPTYEGDDPRILKQYFEPGAGIAADGLILRHVLEHVQDPVAFLRNLATANGGRGVIYIEVPCFQWICDSRAWYDVFYEHVNYFRIRDFQRMFGRVIESGHLFGGQYLYVVADLASLRDPAGDHADDVVFPVDFLRGLTEVAHRKGPSAEKGPTAAIWGAASKGVIFALLMERAGAAVDLAIDINPAKQGRYLAASGLLVSTPAQAMQILPAGADVFVMNGNYLAEIRAMSGDRFNYICIDAEQQD